MNGTTENSLMSLIEKQLCTAFAGLSEHLATDLNTDREIGIEKPVELCGIVLPSSKKCEYEGCRIIPSFGILGKKAQWCCNHKSNNHVNVVSKKCEYEGCRIIPAFGVPGKKAQWCLQHKLNNHIDVISKICEYKGCCSQPSFGILGKKAQWCLQHKSNNHVNVKHKKCEDIECCTRPYYGQLFKSIIHCAKHRTANEFVNNKPKCECGKDAYYVPGKYTEDKVLEPSSNYPERCEEHKQPTDINVVEQPCANCGLEFFLNDKTKLCDICYDYNIKKVHHAKEKRIGDVLINNGYTFMSADKIPVSDKGVTSSCSKYRPDFVIDYTYYLIIVEVDENQHRAYAKNCETIRMQQLFQDYGGIPLLFIRFNPDNYRNSLNEKGTISQTGREKILLDLLQQMRNEADSADKGMVGIEMPPISYLQICYDGYIENQPIPVTSISEY